MRRAPNPLISTQPSGELDLLKQIRRRAEASGEAGVRLGIGDDCALLRVKPGEEIAVTTDLSIAGRHFDLDLHPPESVGHRTLARGLSDLAAMGARPLAAFLSLGLPRDLAMKKNRARSQNPLWVDRFFNGFLALAAQYRTPLAGGDLAESTLAVADIILVGAVPKGRALLRSGARPGDLVYVTGRLGGSAAGLAHLLQNARKVSNQTRLSQATIDSLHPHLWPQPRIPQGLWLQRRRAATAAIDISDGLSTDLDHMCSESGVSAEIDQDSIPVGAGASLEQALHGGEDYELLFTAGPDVCIPTRIAGVTITPIGRTLKSRAGQPRVSLVTGTGRKPLPRRGWEHFA